MTTAEVKELLPDVRVKLGKDIYAGIVTGRYKPFATVFVITDAGISSWEYAWETIAHAVTTDTPLTI